MPTTLSFADFSMSRAASELRYDNAYLIYDRTGQVIQEARGHFTNFKVTSATPNESTFLSDEGSFGLQLGSCRFISDKADASLESFGSSCKRYFDIVAELLDIRMFTRVGLRVITKKTTKDIRSWRKRRKVTTEVIQDLECYTEAPPRVQKDGLFDLKPQQCDPEHECSLAAQLKARPEMLKALRDAIPENSIRREDRERRAVLKQLIRNSKSPLDRESCCKLGDAIFAFFCPETAVVLTTNLRDHKPLAEALGKNAEAP